MFKSVLFIGDGAWATALGLILNAKKVRVKIWGAFPEYTRVIQEKRQNLKFLPGIELPASIEFFADFRDNCQDIDLVVVSTPTQFIRPVLEKFRPFYRQEVPVLSIAKGIELKTFLAPSRIINSVLPEAKVAVLSGPSHAEEVARFLPTAVVVASHDRELARAIQRTFSMESFRCYRSRDLVGVEMGGALKNVIAIAAGICDGLGLGDNTKSALLTRGLVEIIRFGSIYNVSQETFQGLSGMGDLITTCISPHGRNRYVGEQIGKGKKLSQLLAEMEKVAEGVWTTQAVYNISQDRGVEMPIITEVYKVLFQDKDPLQAINNLMTRKLKSESTTSE